MSTQQRRQLPVESCHHASLSCDEALVATAIENVDVWVLVEAPGRWEPDIARYPFSEPACDWLARVKARPRHRLQLVRRSKHADGVAVWVVDSRHARVWKLERHCHDAVAGIELDAVLRGECGAPVDHDLYLVCTHGRRDPCCARLGVPFYNALVKAAPSECVWQSSHLGGHRFAATALVLPHGVQYGRLRADDAPAMVAAHGRGELLGPMHYRGSTKLSRPMQAAEAWVRRKLGAWEFAAATLVECMQLGDDTWRGTFERPSGAAVSVSVRGERGPRRVASCGSEPTCGVRYAVRASH